jgi:hypothetical protein
MSQSWSVLRVDKRLMVFPILSFLACVVVLASFVVPAFLFLPGAAGVFERGRRGGDAEDMRPLFYAGLLLFYFVNYFVVVFFNTALVSCALYRFSGGTPTVGDGLRAAASRLPQIAAWALLAATVGMILRAIEEKVDFVGKLVVSLIGLAWTVVTFLVVPILAVEKLGPFAAVRRSTELLRKSWGENLSGQFSLSAVGFLLALPGILVIFLAGILAAKTGSLPLVLSVGGLGALYLIALSITTSTIQQVFLAGLYLYAAHGKVPAGFSEETMKSAFREKVK